MKSKLLLGTLCIAMIFSTSGCVGYFGHLKYPSNTTLELGKTRNTDYLTMFGKPFSVEVKETKEGTYELVHYQRTIKYLMLTTTYRFRALDLEFRDGVLNAYYFISTIDGERTAINIEQLKKIQQGLSKKSDVLTMMGKPNGMGSCPNYIAAFKDKCDKGAEIWTWELRGEEVVTGGLFLGDPIEKHVFIAFDKNGFVTNVEFSQKKRP